MPEGRVALGQRRRQHTFEGEILYQAAAPATANAGLILQLTVHNAREKVALDGNWITF